MIAIFIIIAVLAAVQSIYLVNVVFKGKLSFDERVAAVIFGLVGVIAAHFAVGNLLFGLFGKVLNISSFKMEQGLILAIVFSTLCTVLYMILLKRRKKELIEKAQEVFSQKIKVDNQLRYRRLVIEMINELFERNRRADNAARLIIGCAEKTIELKQFCEAFEKACDMRILEFIKEFGDYFSPEDRQAVEKSPQELTNIADRLKIEIEYLENQKQAWELADKQGGEL